jgi:HAD superfamily hydrolase (TIGR01509 family)
MNKRFLDDYDVILLDLGNTFMFDADRFGDALGMTSTYMTEGGSLLGASSVARILSATSEIGQVYARNPAFYDSYPKLVDIMREVPEAAKLPAVELQRLARVFAQLERGFIPPSHAVALRALRKTHRLGLVSNVWAPADVFHDALEGANVRSLFDVLVFSSEVGAIKPSPVIFERALAAFDVPRARVVHVGDKLKRDVAGAKALGLGAVWVHPDAAEPGTSDPRPDLVIRDLRELASAPSPQRALT